MKQVEILFASSLVVAVALLGIGFGSQGLWLWVFVFTLVDLIWWYAEQKRGWHWISSVGLTVFMAATGAGYWLGMPVLVMLVVAMLVLVAWDLGSFEQRLVHSQTDATRHLLVQGHLRRLILVNATALALAAFSLTVELRLNFLIAIFLVLVLAFGLNRLLVRLGKLDQS